MSTALKPPPPVTAEGELNTTSSNKPKTDLLSIKNNAKYGIRCKENFFKHKCNKTLKNKLKKYKIRRDGKEDPEVINVSQTFQCSLRIKSPNNNNIEELNLYDTEIRPKNYLFKMVRRKRNVENAKTVIKEVLRDNTTDNRIVSAEPGNEEIILTPNSQDKKHTNAFKLMMDSRNKSIGGNSPGKEKSVDDTELQLITEEKKNKAKRLLVLQKLAEAKGSLKKQEKEEMLDEAIKTKMQKRAERLANMLVQSNSYKQTKAKKEQPTLVNKELEVKLRTPDEKEVDEKKVSSRKSNAKLNLIDMFDEPVQIQTNKKDIIEKRVPKEDLEFLKKLSPSIKKKENMLCYFKKLEKDDETLSPVVTEDVDGDQCSPIIKVKFTARNKRKPRKKKLSLKTEKSCDTEDENTCTEIKIQDEDVVTNLATNVKSDTRKRKRAQITEVKNIQMPDNHQSLTEFVEKNESINERPKRNVKKPTQYTDDFILSSSDEEIFTPKKKKHIDKKFETPKLNKELKTATSCASKPAKNNMKNVKKLTNNDDVKKTNVKLAPIFAPKPQIDQAALEAKQKFLQSGVPDKLKKIVNQQKQIETEMNCFSKVVHVQQTVTTNKIMANISFNDLLTCDDSETDLSPIECSEQRFETILSPEKPNKNKLLSKPDNNIRKVLQNIKLSYPKFPVYRTYRLLKAKSKGEFGDSQFPELDNSVEIISNIVDFNKMQVDKLNWTDKYKPTATNQIIGNFDTTKELKKWLETWCANDVKGRINDKADSDSSDFCYSDPDSRDSMKTTDNLLILTGPTGCGKTSCVYAVAAELAIKVIEVNASSKRNGKIMLQDLQEATQSHKVNRGKGSSAENSQRSQEIVDVDLSIKVDKKRGRPKKTKEVVVKSKKEVFSQSTNSQENGITAMSLILIDDADIVFEQDDGFCSAISQLIQYSKRPVILVTSSLICPHLQRFLQVGKIMNMKPLLPRMLGTWLDIMCLADGGACWPGLGAVLLDLFKGDIRKTINCLQFYASTHIEQESSQLEESSQNHPFLNDENSSISWAGSENQEEHHVTRATTCVQEGDSAWKYFMEKQCHLFHIRLPSDLWNVWWNIPNFLNNAHENAKITEEPNDKQKQTRELSEIANIVEHISAADYFVHRRPDARFDISSQPWSSYECDSSSEYENFSNYSKSLDINDDIAKTLVVRSMCNAQKNLQCEDELYLKPTKMSVQRERDRVVSRHNTISTHLNPAAMLDRRALALDYWSACRAICRFEKTKTDTNSKRNNRFCHYLRSLKVMCKNDVFDKLSESLSVKEDNV